MAKIYIVAYDVLNDDDDERRKELRDATASSFLDRYEHFELSVYLVATRKGSAEEVYDVLDPYTKSRDRLLVGLVPKTYFNGCPGLLAWLKKNRAA